MGGSFEIKGVEDGRGEKAKDSLLKEYKRKRNRKEDERNS